MQALRGTFLRLCCCPYQREIRYVIDNDEHPKPFFMLLLFIHVLASQSKEKMLNAKKKFKYVKKKKDYRSAKRVNKLVRRTSAPNAIKIFRVTKRREFQESSRYASLSKTS